MGQASLLYPKKGVWIGGLEERVKSIALPSNKDEAEGDFPGGPVGKTLCSQCRGPRFDPGSGN